MKNRFARFALRTSLIYAVVAGLWILLSDRVLSAIVSDPRTVNAAQTYKGWGFVAITSVLLYLMVRGQLRRWEKEVAARRLAEASLRASETRFRQFSEISTEGIVLLGNSVIIDANTAVAGMFGYLPEELVGKDPLELVVQGSRTSLGASLGGDTGSSVEVTGLRKDGSSFPLEVEPRSYITEGRAKRFVCFRDITERKRLETEHVELQRQLLHAQKLESLGVLAGGIAHDFNNLLMAVLGNLDLARDEVPPSSRTSLERAISAAYRAADLTRAMLAYSGKGRFEVSLFDLNDLVRENAELFRAGVSRNVTLDLSLAAEPAAIRADPGQVQQVIMNLITNASEAIGDAPGAIRISTSVMNRDARYLSGSRTVEKPAPGRYASIEVADTGGGMSESTRQRLFDPFYTTKFTGRGLGMSAVLGIVMGHKGAIMVESAEGRGTTICVLFPASEAVVPLPSTPPDRAHVQSAADVFRVALVVDDEEAVRDVGSALVVRLGFTAVCAADGEEAVGLFATHAEKLAFVLLDMTMPRMDGLSALREMKRRRPEIPVILSSGYGERDAAQRHTDISADGFIQKPYSLEQLESTIWSVLGAPGSAREEARG